MGELFTQLGVNLPALIAQAFNFLVVLVVLTVYVYKPLAKMMEERSLKIEAGLRAADEGEKRLADIAETARLRAAQSEQEALEVMHEAKREGDAIVKNSVVLGEAKGAGIVEEAHAQALRLEAEGMAHVEREARAFVKEVLEKTVLLDPKLVDDRLIAQAVDLVKNSARS